MGVAGNRNIESGDAGFPEVGENSIADIVVAGVEEEVFPVNLDEDGVTVAYVDVVDGEIGGGEGGKEENNQENYWEFDSITLRAGVSNAIQNVVHTSFQRRLLVYALTIKLETVGIDMFNTRLINLKNNRIIFLLRDTLLIRSLPFPVFLNNQPGIIRHIHQ